VLDRVDWDEATGEVVYRARPGRADSARFGPYEFIAAVLDHPPLPNQQLVRYWGHYSNVSRGRRRAAGSAEPEAAGLDDDAASQMPAMAMSWPDFEDAVQAACPAKAEVDYLVTRNPDDFRGADVEVVRPAELIAQVPPDEDS